ncbi:MAG: methylated-DNA--[protein]-cysteine S-methyltransferase [Acidobacteria bacterium]|nr:MAG: methylated-DNA--[protein]-cysteine S-methyltransferase [Acidobacteriota bacterium]
MEKLFRTVMDSPVGPLTLVVSGQGLREIHFGDVSTPGATDNPRQTAAVARQLREYFAGRRQQFDLKLDWHGTDFQRSVWRALVRIPYGKTVSYADVARKVGKPKAFRAVGGANRANPIPIVVPCHRVLGSDGSLTGYSGPTRLDIKAQLLALEAAQ